MCRRRLALEWRAAVAVSVAATAGVVLASCRAVGVAWLLGIFGVIVLIAASAVIAAFWDPLELPTMPQRYRYREATAAQARVRRGEPVDPSELQAAAIGRVRRDLRIAHLTIGCQPVLGATWALRIGEEGFFGGFGYVGLAVMVFGISALAWSGVTQCRVDRLEDTSTVPRRGLE